METTICAAVFGEPDPIAAVFGEPDPIAAVFGEPDPIPITIHRRQVLGTPEGEAIGDTGEQIEV